MSISIESRKRGRPNRSAVDPLRTAVWASAIWPPSLDAPRERVQGLSDAIGCVDPARQSARWYKYLNGLTTPSPQVASAVDDWLPGTLSILHHPLWDLIAHRALSPVELRNHVSRLEEFSDLMADRKMPSDALATFWRRPDLDHRSVLNRVVKTYEDEPRRAGVRTYLGLTGIIAAMIHDAEHRQRQVQHFEVHWALGQALQLAAQTSLPAGSWLGKVEALLIERWLSTEYKHSTLRTYMQRLAAVDEKEVRSNLDPSLTPDAVHRLKPSQSRWVLELMCQRRIDLKLPSDV